MAEQRIDELVAAITGALDRAGIRYAVIGGCAVAAWVATKDRGAVRATKDVDVLLDRSDFPAVDNAARSVGLYLDSVGNIPDLLDVDDPLPSMGVHIICAGERVRPNELHPAPRLDESERSRAGFSVINVPALLRMKLTAFRKHDQVHVEDMIRVGLITPEVRAQIPADLLPRLDEIERDMRD